MCRKAILLLLVILTSISSFSQNTEKSYDYPIKRGTSEWYSIKTYDSLRKVCQIPFDVVDKMSTGTLLESIIDYPLLGDVFVFENFQRGLEKLAENFSAFAAILQRADLDVTLLKRYANFLDKNVNSATNLRKGEYSVQLSFVELLISYSFQQKKTMSAYNKLYLNQLLRAYEKKKKNTEIFGTMSLSTCAWTMNNILLADRTTEKFAMKEMFIQNGNTFSASINARIANQADVFLKQTNP